MGQGGAFRCDVGFCDAVLTISVSLTLESRLLIRGVPPWMEMDRSLHTVFLYHQLGATQKAHGLKLKAEVDTEVISSWKLSAKDIPRNWVTCSFLKGDLSEYMTQNKTIQKFSFDYLDLHSEIISKDMGFSGRRGEGVLQFCGKKRKHEIVEERNYEYAGISKQH